MPENDPRLSLDLPDSATGRTLETPGRGAGRVVFAPDVARTRHLVDYVKVLHKRRRLVLSVFLLIFVTTVVYTFTRIPVYEARAKLLIDNADPSYVDFKEVLTSTRESSDYYQTQYDLLKSRSLARKTLAAADLWEHFGGRPGPAPAPPTGWRAWASNIKRAVVSESGTTAPVAGAPDSRETAAQTRAINRLLGGLTVAPIRNSRIVDLKFQSADRDTAMRIVNAHARSYIEQNLEFKFMSSKEATDWLAERLGEQRKQVEEAETALQRYREQNDAIAADAGDNIVIQKLADISREVTRAKTARLEKEAIYNQLRSMEHSSLDSFPAILANEVIQGLQADLAKLQRQRADLSQKYLDTHPEMETLSSAINAMEQRVRGEIAKVVQGVRNDYMAASAAEQSMSGALNEQKREALAMNRKAIDYGVLAREVESSRQVYQALLQRSQETGVSREMRTSNVRIVDLAERPGGPVFPQTRSNIFLGFFGGLFIAICVGFFFEYLDNRIKTPDDLKSHLGIPPLGLLPLVRDGKDGAGVLAERLSPKFNEALRTLRTNVVFSAPESSDAHTLVVTSTGPGEGKTLVSSNLAASLAEAGLRVLAIDADMRKPRLHSTLKISQEPGLSNLIVGTCKASEAVVKTSIPGLWALPAGRIPPNPAELLGSQRFREFLRSVREHFDWVIIDTPPVLAVADASVLAHAVSGVVFVIGAEMVSRHTAATALEQLENAHAKLLGGVLNRVDLDRNAYYYSQYYRKEYADYYTQSKAS